MAKDPAFLFYPGDWLGGTMYMTMQQRGCYITLLMLQFNTGPFTIAQAEQVLSICFASDWDMIKSKFNTDGIHYWNERLKNEKELRQNFTNSRRINALSEKPKPKLKKASAKHIHEHMEDENEDVNDSKKENKEGVQGEKFLIPQMWEVWKSVKPKYPADKKKDFEPLKKIAEFICGQERIVWIPTEPTETAQILTIWRTLGEYIELDKFFKKYSLEQVERHIQSISQSFQENKPKTFKDVQNESDDYIDEMFKKSEFNGR